MKKANKILAVIALAALIGFSVMSCVTLFTVTYNPNGGVGDISPDTVSDGEKITLPSGITYTRTGYTFVGWNTESDGTGDSYAVGEEYTVTGNVTFYAQWEAALTPGVWTDGNLPGRFDVHWYSINVTYGTTYRIWWNDSYEGNNSKDGDVVVGARYVGSSTWLFGGTDTSVDSGWYTASYFTATQTGTVEIRVIPYSRSSSYTGSFGIVYSTGTTRP
jgi:uncharacterized repeat protein (TIGR02543 family)